MLHDQTRLGPGAPGQSGVPRTLSGVATPGNSAFFVGVTAGAFNAAAVVGVSLAVLPFPDALGNMLELSPAALLLPSGSLGFFQTDALGTVVWPVPLPPPPLLTGQTVFLEWAIADAVSSTGLSVTPARKIVFW